MEKYKVSKEKLENKEMVWNSFMYFLRMFIPYEDNFDKLTPEQTPPVIAFVYMSEVFGDGHLEFVEVYQETISLTKVMEAITILNIDEKYNENLSGIPQDFYLPEEWLEEDEEVYKNMFQPLDDILYGYEQDEIIEKIEDYLWEHKDVFFEIV